MGQMPEYSAYILGPDGHIQSRLDLICRDEADARGQAKALAGGFDVELWELNKRIGLFKGQTRPSRMMG